MNDKNSMKRARLGIGVSFDKKRGGKNYKTRIHFRSREVLLGRYKTCHEARLAYDQAASMLARYKDGVSTNYPPGTYSFYDPSVERKVLALLVATEADTKFPAGSRKQHQPQALMDFATSAVEAQQEAMQCSYQPPDDPAMLAALAVDEPLLSCSSDSSTISSELVRQDSHNFQQKQEALLQSQQQLPQLQLQQQPQEERARQQPFISSNANPEPRSFIQLPLVVCDAPLSELLQAVIDLPSKTAATQGAEVSNAACS